MVRGSTAAAAIQPVPAMSNEALISQLQELTKQMSGFTARFDKLEEILGALKIENRDLKATIADRDQEIFALRDRLNGLEQYGRNWSIRILDLPIPDSEARDPKKVMQIAYNKVLLPIFQGALSRKEIPAIPKVEEILETAHILPAKPNSTPAIIARFYSRNIRSMVFRLKKEFAPRHPAEAGRPVRGSIQRPGKFLHPIYEDLTRPTFFKMRALASHELVESCWSVNGIIKYKMKNNSEIRKVKSIFASIEEIIG